MKDFLTHLMNYDEAIAATTMLLSVIGMFISFKHALYFNRTKETMARRIRGVFFTDGLIYTITLCFGVGAYIGLTSEQWNFLQFLREPILIANIVQSWRLYSHYKMID